MSEIGTPKPQEETREKRVDKPVTNNVKVKKKSELHKFSDIFIAEDMSNVGSYVFTEVLVPAIKKAVSDIVRDGIDMLLYGSTGHSKKSSSNVSYVSYNKMSERRDDRRAYNEPRTRGYNYDNITFDNRGEAEEVLTQMENIIDNYTMVSVGDLYDLVGVTGNFTDQNYGWLSLRSAKVVRVRDGYVIELPKAVPLK